MRKALLLATLLAGFSLAPKAEAATVLLTTTWSDTPTCNATFPQELLGVPWAPVSGLYETYWPGNTNNCGLVMGYNGAAGYAWTALGASVTHPLGHVVVKPMGASTPQTAVVGFSYQNGPIVFGFAITNTGACAAFIYTAQAPCPSGINFGSYGKDFDYEGIFAPPGGTSMVRLKTPGQTAFGPWYTVPTPTNGSAVSYVDQAAMTESVGPVGQSGNVELGVTTWSEITP